MVWAPLALFFMASAFTAEPNPPQWPSNVYVFDPSNPGATQAAIDQVYKENGGHDPAFHGQFSSSRYALLFKPGVHNVVANIGYYTSAIGVGKSPSETTIQRLQCENGDFNYEGGALDNFWRSAENFATGTALWAVSQAAPLRRVVVKGDLALFQYNSGCCAGYASGGYLADSTVSGQILSGSQQQWLTRNSVMGNWDGAVWNMVFVGCTGGVPQEHCQTTENSKPFTVIKTTPVIAEKPYIAVDQQGKWTLRVPRTEWNKVGPTTNWDHVDIYDFSQVFVARQTDSADLINQKLASGLHILLTPGNYELSTSIKITKHNTTVLGIGFPTLTATAGTPVFEVGAASGVRLSSVLIQAGKIRSPTLVHWGQKGYGEEGNPSFLHDVFVRVGGTNDPTKYQVSADTMIQIDSNHVVVDNTWLWRADHDLRGIVVQGQNPTLYGLVVNGNSVTAYGLASEHHLKDGTVWNGEDGNTYFYQCELPYDVTQQEFGDPGYVGYRVASEVKKHQVHGAGVYSFFRDHAVTTENGILAPQSPSVVFTHSFTRFLNGKGAINHVINGKGDQVNATSPLAYVC